MMPAPLPSSSRFCWSRWVSYGLWAATIVTPQAPASAQSIAPTSQDLGTTVTQSGTTYEITGGTQSGGNLFHSFETFGLESGEVANFIGSPALSNILGRVTGGEASLINGLLQVSNSNANLFLMNPAGLVFGPGASLDLAGSFTGTTATAIGFEQGTFTASGANDYATLAGRPNQFQFAAATATGGAGLPGGSIVNLGNLSVAPGQTLSLLGRAVFNTGTLSAPGGQVAVVAVPGTETQVLRYTEPGMVLGLELLTLADGEESIPLANLEPTQLPAYLTGGDLSHASALIVEPDGTVRLGSAVVPAEAGAVMVSGLVDAANGTGAGGDVVLTGTQVGLLDATVTASGETGGGNIRVGGDYQGNGSLPTAIVTYGDAESDLSADAGSIGHGGTIIVWADHSTRFYGTASAQGGAQGGNGGLVETSGKIFLDVAGSTVNTSASAGKTGTWLLDPVNLTILAGSDYDITGNPNFTTAGTGGAATLSKATLEAALAVNNVTITTSDGGGGDGDITLDATIDSSSGQDLTLTARRFIFRSGGFNLTGDLTFNLNQVNPEPNAPTRSIQAAHDAIGSIGGTTTINLGAGTFSGATLNLSKNVTLLGAGSGQTFLDGRATRRVSGQTFLDGRATRRVIDMSGGVSNISEVTIQNGRVVGGSGGGIRVADYSNLTLNNSIVTGNVVDVGSGAGIFGGFGSTLVLNNTRIENNQATYYGGGIHNAGGSVTLNNSTVSGNFVSNTEGSGAGISNMSGGDITLTNSIISGNLASGNGGGIYNSDGSITLTNSTVSGNTAGENGGGIYSTYATLLVQTSTIAGNSSISGQGGGIHNNGGTVTLGDITLTNSIISGNLASGNGGGIYNSDGSITLTNSTVSGNTARENGGGIYNSSGSITLTNRTVSGNTAGENGGGIYGTYAALLVQTSTIAGNTSTRGQGGGIHNNGGTVTLTDSTVSGNIALDSGGIHSLGYVGNGSSFLGTVNVTNTTIANNTATSGSAGGIQSAANTVLTLTNSLLANSLLADNRTGIGEGGDVVLATGVSPTLNGINLIENATGLASGPTLIQGVDPKLSPLGSYGGPTQTHLILPGSVAIDAGDSGLAVGLLDQRGGTRVVGTAIDLGAVEFQGANFSIVAGDGQSTTVNTNFATPLTVISATETTFGNSLSGGTVTFSAPTSGASATLASPSTVLDTSSQGSTLATANTIAGTFAVTASLGTSSTTFTLTNLAGAPSNLIILGGNNQSTIVNTAFSSPLSVQVTDQYGNPVSGTLVAFTAPTSGASSQNTNLSLSTNSNGTASTAYSANTVAGSYPVTSTVANTSISTAFSLTNLADAPSVLTIDTGNNQSATIDTPFTNALAVLVTDQYGNPVSGVPVNFAVQGGLTGASGILSRSSGVSDANGRVSTTLTANVQQGSFQVVAQASGFNASATFDLQNTSVGETACPPNCDDSITENNDESTSGSEPPDDAPLLVTPNAVTTETVDNTTFTAREAVQTDAFSTYLNIPSPGPHDAPLLVTPNAVTTETVDNTTFTAREAVQTDAFSTYLNIPSPGPLTVGEAQNIIRDRDEATGTTTAYITSRFAPITTSGSEISSRLQNSGPAADQMAAATPVLTKELDPLKPWLGQLPGGTAASPDDRLEIVVMTAAGTPQLKRLPVTRRQVESLADRLQQDLDKPVGVYRRHMQALYAQLFAPLEAELQALGVDQLLLSLGESLRSIPWGALYDGEQFLVEKYGIGVTPSLSLTDTTYAPLHDRPVLAMGASEFESQNPLPAVPIELNTITQQLETASSFLNQDFTVTKLLEAREQLNPGVIHLATHANFQAGDLDQSYIQLWGDERISIGEIDRLQWFADPPVELLVLSACRTALGDRQAELGFGGLAVKSGVRSAMASLWYVSDVGTLALMTEFYRNLRNPEITTKSEALRQAQISLIRGDVRIESAELRGGSSQSPYAVPLPADTTDLNAETLAHPYYWAAFTLIGNPW